MPNFNDETIAKLFGAEDAEMESAERFRQYFVYNKTYDNVVSTLPLRILVGHKGVGKSALLRRAHMHDEDNGTMAIWVRPNDVLAVTKNRDQSDFSALVEYWKQGLLAIIAKHVLGDAADSFLTKEKMPGFASRIGSFVGALTTAVASKTGNALAEINQGIVDNFIKTGIVHVYIDDIDRGWSASKSDIMNISALLGAMRDIAGSDGERRVRFRIGLRSDVYYLVRTSDESTDKIETSVVWLSWSNHEVLLIMAKRIESYFGIEHNQSALLKMDQPSITRNILSKVIEPKFLGAGHWSNAPIHTVLLSLTRQRPRDLVKLMHGAAKYAQAANHDIITSNDLERAFPAYSNERLQDIINEFRSELPEI